MLTEQKVPKLSQIHMDNFDFFFWLPEKGKVDQPVHVNVLSLTKILLARIADAEKTLRGKAGQSVGEKTIFFSGIREPRTTTAALNNAVLKNMSGSGVRTMRNHTSIVL